MAPLSREPSSQPSIGSNKPRRQASVYDAVAGRVSSRGFLVDTPTTTKNRDTTNSTSVAVPPEEVLFRRCGAPERYEEDDIYWADRHLTEEQKLPDSDILEAIHAYASDFYRNATHDGGMIDFASMDETALLAIGILLEEAATQCLGDTGDMVFVEGETKEPQEDLRSTLSEVRARRGSATIKESTSRRRHKRRKVQHDVVDSV